MAARTCIPQIALIGTISRIDHRTLFTNQPLCVLEYNIIIMAVKMMTHSTSAK